ncbi:MAG: hypothetical protein J3Q66DRAFT_408861 [Benniella sp.]|nr:MAG: hypothetical protein J3Q66DRAFT_408861 [Benniella sp.]
MFFSTPSKASLVLIVAYSLLILILTQEAESHSWVECLDWKFKDPKKQSWAEEDGRCEGYPRRFPVGLKPFGTFDDRYYLQKSWPPCARRRSFDETLTNPPEMAYQGTDMLSGKSYGPMTVKKAGERLCIRWPAKNHQYAVGATSVFIGISGVNPTKDPTQRDFTSQRIATLDYNNCFGENGDTTPCGGCFNLPKDLQVGYYAVQWRWSLNRNKWYTSCADMKITK